MLCSALPILRNSCMSRSAFCDASHVLTWISSAKDKGSSSGMLSISKSVGNSLLGLDAVLNDLCSAGGVLSMPVYSTDLSFKVFKGTHLSSL